jgi:monofunctional biosynthetic peptidoglycan transglycosylase
VASLAARWIAAVVLAGLAVTVGLVGALRWMTPPFTAMMLEQPGPLADIDYRWVERDAISEAAVRAVIASEDQRFFDHHGIDFASLNDAIDDYRAGDGLRGASTITQQVAKNVFLWSGRSYVRKGLEAYFALLLEALLPKERILEIYLNIAELGPQVFGVEAAAQHFFGTSAARLTPQQAALLAAVLPNPQRLRVDKPTPYVRGRQAWVLGQMRLLDTRGHYRPLEW